MNLGAGEVIFIAIFALLVFGPKRLPEIGRSVGKALAELRKATNELKDGFTAGFEDFKDFKDFKEPLFLNGPIKATRVTPRTLPADPSAPTVGESPSPSDASPFPTSPTDPTAGQGPSPSNASPSNASPSPTFPTDPTAGQGPSPSNASPSNASPSNASRSPDLPSPSLPREDEAEPR